MNCLASGNFINYSLVSFFVVGVLKSSLDNRINDSFFNENLVSLFVDSFRGLMYSLTDQFDRGFFNFDYLVSLFKYSLDNRLNDSFLNDNFVSFVGVLIYSLDKQFDIRLLEFFRPGLRALTIDSIISLGLRISISISATASGSSSASERSNGSFSSTAPSCMELSIAT